MNRRAATTNRQRQQGALSVVTPLLLLIVVVLSVMTLDGARLFSLRSDMQSIANVAAQAAASNTHSCGGDAPDISVIEAQAFAAAQAQGYDGEASGLNVQVGVVDSTDAQGTLLFTPVTFIEESNAVRVSLTRNEPLSRLLPRRLTGDVTLSVSAAARKEVVGTFSAAGSTATVGPEFLGAIIGAVLNDNNYVLDPTSLNSLRNTTVRLGDVLTQAGVASLTDLLNADGSVFIQALRDLSGAASPAGQMLDDLLAANGISTIQVADILDVAGNTSAAQDSQFPLYDAVVSSALNIAQTQQGTGFLNVPLNIDIDRSPLARISSDVQLSVGAAPRIVIGPARQDSNGDWLTQFRAPDVHLQINSQIEVLGGGFLNLADISLPLAVDAGGMQGAFVNALCASGQTNSVTLDIEFSRDVATVASGTIDPQTGAINSQPITVSVLGLLPLFPVIDVAATLEGDIPGAATQRARADNYPLYCDASQGCSAHTYNTSGGGSSDVVLDINIDQAALAGINLGPLLNPLLDFLEDLLEDSVSALADELLNPLLQTLGVELGGAVVTVTQASQQRAQLFENIPVTDP